MRIPIFLIGMLVLLSEMLQAQGDNRKLEGFNGIEVRHGLRLVLDPSLEPGEVQISMTKGNAYEVKTEISNNRLVVSTGELINGPKGEVRVGPPEELFFVEVNTGAVFVSDFPLQAGTVRLQAISDGQIMMAVSADHVFCVANSSGIIRLKGGSRTSAIEAHSGGLIDMESFRVQEVTVDATTSGEITVYPKQKLEGKVNTGGTLNCQPNVPQYQIKVGLGGVVNRKNKTQN